MKPRSASKRTESGEILAKEAATRLGLTHQAIGQWTMRPGCPCRKEGSRVYVQWPAFARWREAEMLAKATRDASPAVSLDDARTRKALAEAELAELEVAKARGEFVAVSDSVKALARMLDILNGRLRALGPRMAHFGEEVEEATEREAESIIEELSQFDADVIDEPDDDEPEAVAA